MKISDVAVEKLREAFYITGGIAPDERWRVALEAAAPYLEPAGDGGLREALGKLVVRYRQWTSHRAIADNLEALLAAHPAAPAVPLPVDREALAICLHSFDGYAIEAGESWGECMRKNAFLYQADAVLALLGGSGKS